MNFKIEPLADGKTFRIRARIKRNGKEYSKRETLTCTRRQAERRGIELVWLCEDMADNDNPSRSLTTFNECIELYRARKEVKRADESYFKRLQQELGNISINDMPKALDRFISLLSRTRTRKGTFYSSGTLNRYQQWTRAILNFACDWDAIEENPLKKIRKFKETPRDKSISIEEQKKLISVIKEFRPYLLPIVKFALQIPSRVSELVNAKISDVDTVNNLLRIRNGKTKNGQGVNKPIPPNMVEYFKHLPPESEWVFFRFEANRYKPLKNFNRAWRFVCEKANLDDLRFHDLRHFAATELIHIGLSEREVMQVAGWKTNMLSIYYHRDGLGAAKAVFNALHQKM